MTSRHPMRLTGITLLIVLFIGAFGIPPASLAKDTDVYLKAQGAARDDSPNILIILDNSGSMNTVITAASRLAYNPSINYSAESGSPGFNNNRVYWSSNGTPPNDNSTNRWVSTSNNNCTSSSANLGAGGSGIYSGDKVVGWKRNSGSSYPPSGTTQGAWTSLSNNGGNNGGWGDTVLECKLDNPASASGTYVATNTTNYNARYVNSPAPTTTWWNARSTVNLYSGNYMNYIRNSDQTNTNVWDPAVTRIDAAKAAVSAIIDSTQNVRFGLMVFNNNNTSPDGGRVLMRVDTMDATRRTAMKNIVNSINATTYTPLAETMWEAYRYYGGLSATYGNPSPTQTPHQDSCAQNDTNSACNNGGAYDAIAAGNSAYNDGTYISPFKYACQKGYIIYVTDGDPTNDSSADANIKTRIGKTSCSTSTGSDGSTVTSCLSDLAEWMSKNDVYSSITGNQTLVSYTVGFGGSISPSGLKLLQDTATKTGGKYYDAADADALTTALSDALFEILQVTTSYAAPTLSVNAFNTLYNRDDVYFAQFKPSESTLWDGNVKKYSLCKNTTATCTFGDLIDKNGNKAVDLTTNKIKDGAVSFWNSVIDGNNVTLGGAGAKIPASSSRNVYTYTGGYDATNGRTPSGGNTDLTNTNNLVEDSNTSLTATMLNVSTAAERTTIIDWMRGLDVRGTDPTVDRWRFADPIHSRPIAVNYGGTSAAPVIKLFVGSNDGGLRMINENNGIEEWIFYPQEVLAMLNGLSFDTSGEHLWGIDGSVAVYAQDRSQSGATVVDVPDGIIDPSTTGVGDFVHAYVGMRRGGNNIYALDVTPGSILTSPTATGGITPKLMWVIRGGTGGTPGFASLAQTWSKPQIAKIRYAGTSSKTVLIFAGGYDPGNDALLPAKSPAAGNAIYIVDPSTGERLWWAGASPAGCTGTDCPDLPLPAMTYSIPSDLALMDANADGYVDRIYVGDLGGQVWRIDLSPSLQKNTNGGSSGYVFANLAGSSTQDKRKFYYPPDIAQVYDATYEDASQAKHDLVTIASGDREDPIDIITSNMVPTQTQVHNRIYVMRDYNTSNLKVGGTLSYPASITDANLYDATANSLQTATGATLATEIAAIKTKKGWYIDLSNSGSWVGEKSLAQPTIYAGTLFISTFTPASAATASLTCSADEGLAKLYGLNILNGGASADWDYNGTINTADRSINVGGGIPPETVIIVRSEGNSGLVGVTNVPKLSQNPGRSKSGWFVK